MRAQTHQTFHLPQLKVRRGTRECQVMSLCPYWESAPWLCSMGQLMLNREDLDRENPSFRIGARCPAFPWLPAYLE